MDEETLAPNGASVFRSNSEQEMETWIYRRF